MTSPSKSLGALAIAFALICSAACSDGDDGGPVGSGGGGGAAGSDATGGSSGGDSGSGGGSAGSGAGGGGYAPPEGINKYYTSTTGSDSNPGTLAAPFKTLAKGVSVLEPGDTLYVRGGTYKRTTDLWIPPSGTSWEKAITVTNYNKEQVIVTPRNTTNCCNSAGNSVFYFPDGDTQYVIINGLILDAEGGSMALRTGLGNHHIRISNGEMKNGIASLMQSGKATHLQVVNMKIHNSKAGYGIYHNGKNSLFDGNDIYDNAGFGLRIYSVSGPASDNVALNNRFWGNGWMPQDHPLQTGAHGRVGIVIGGGAAGNTVINNLFWENYRGIHLMGSAGPGTRIYNNTFYKNDVTGLMIENPNCEVKNNISFGNGGGDVVVTAAVTSNNLLGVEPGFVNVSKADFRLKSDSPAVDGGVTLSDVKTDFVGTARPQGDHYDVGAYEYMP